MKATVFNSLGKIYRDVFPSFKWIIAVIKWEAIKGAAIDMRPLNRSPAATFQFYSTVHIRGYTCTDVNLEIIYLCSYNICMLNNFLIYKL